MEKKREVKEIQKEEENKKANKVHVNSEICAIPPTEDEIKTRFKGSYLENMKFSSFQPLIDIKGRIQCPKCKSNRKFYCYLCYEPLVEKIPRVKLPINFTILKHPGEKMSKSSIIASKVICPDNIEINNTLEVCDFDVDSTILLFPKDDSVPITSMTREECSKIKTAVLIDSTWLQVNKFLNNDNVKKLKCVVINTEKTIFWRYQTKKLDENLSTIEAMYFFLRDYDRVMSDQDYEEQSKYDDILYFYAYNYALIQNEYSKGFKKDKNFRRINNYINKEDNTESTKQPKVEEEHKE